MGLSLTNTHIHNLANLTKPQFKKTLTDMMKAKGYVKATEDDASVSFSLVFTKDRKWVTVLGEDINASDLAKSLDLQVLSVELVDSDFAELKLHTADGAADILMLGRPYMEDYPDPTPEKWQSILGESTWSQVEEIQSGDHTFAEDALDEFAQLIGLGENILLESDDIPDGAEILHFKKAKEKKLTLNAAFKQVFGPELEKQGFKLVKGATPPVYLRVISEDIIHVISVENVTGRSAVTMDEKAFEIIGDAFSLYDNSWAEYFPHGGNQENWLVYRELTNRNKNVEFDYRYISNIHGFVYKKDEPDSLIDKIEYALRITKDNLLKELNTVVDNESCIRYYTIFHFGSINLRFAFNECGKIESGLKESGDSSLMLIKMNDKDDGMWDLKEKCELIARGLNNRHKGFDQVEYQKEYDEKNNFRLEKIRIRDTIYNTPELYEQAIAIADRVKEENIEILRKHGIEM